MGNLQVRFCEGHCVSSRLYLINKQKGNRNVYSTVISNEEWSSHFYKTYLNDIESTTQRLTTGFNYWRRNTNNSICKVSEDARNNFDIDARIEFVFRDEFNKCFHIYAFTSNKKNADKAYNFYDLYRAKLLKFITHFRHNAAQLIYECDKPENRILIPKYKHDYHEQKREYFKEIQREQASLNLTDREFEVMILYAGGASAKQIATMLDKSPKTIETHLDNLRKKTGHADRLAMHKYVIDNGWGDLIRFFFPYVPQEVV